MSNCQGIVNSLQAVHAFCSNRVGKLSNDIEYLTMKDDALKLKETFEELLIIDRLKQATDAALKSLRTGAKDTDILDYCYYWTRYAV